MNEVGFLVSKGVLCFYDKQNNTWLLVDMEFLLSCSIRHLTRSLCSFVSYRFEHSKRNCISSRAHVLFSIYHINFGVLQGFLALKKAVATHVKKHRIFSRVLMYNQLHTRHSPLAPLGQVDEWTAKFSRLVVCRSFLELWRRKNKKFRIADRQRGSNFPRR